MKYFKFYVDDFLVGTSFMTNEEIGIYLKMLCYQWDKGKISQDINKLSIMFGGEITKNILDKFKIDEEGSYFNERLFIEREKAQDKLNKLKVAGKKGAASRHKQMELIPLDITDPGKPVAEDFKFRIGIENYNILPSEFLQEYCKSYCDNIISQSNIPINDRNGLFKQVLALIDNNYTYYDFNSVNHVKNTFKAVLNNFIHHDKIKLSKNGSDSFD